MNLKRMISPLDFCKIKAGGPSFYVVTALFLILSGCAVTRSQVRKVALPEDMPAREAFINPLPGARVISNFGPRDGQFHQGIDLKKSDHGGDPVLAAREGVVEAAKKNFGYGRMVAIRHRDGSSTRYVCPVSGFTNYTNSFMDSPATAGRLLRSERMTKPFYFNSNFLLC